MLTPLIYRICVESHLSPDWTAMPGVLAWATDDAAHDLPITSLLLEVSGQAQLLGILDEILSANLALLSVTLVGGTDAGGAAGVAPGHGRRPALSSL